MPRTQARSSGFENDWREFDSTLRCFDTVFQRPYRDFSIALIVFSLSDRYLIFTSNWLWIENCENVVLSKIDITITTITKNFEIE